MAGLKGANALSQALERLCEARRVSYNLILDQNSGSLYSFRFTFPTATYGEYSLFRVEFICSSPYPKLPPGMGSVPQG